MPLPASLVASLGMAMHLPTGQLDCIPCAKYLLVFEQATVGCRILDPVGQNASALHCCLLQDAQASFWCCCHWPLEP